MSKVQNNSPDNPFLLWIRTELSQRMAQNLPFIKIEPRHLLLDHRIEVQAIKELKKGYPKATIYGNFAVNNGFFETYWPFKKRLLEAHPPKNPVDLLWSCNGILQKNQLMEAQVDRWYQQTADNGLLMLAYLGPDTAKEYKELLPNILTLMDMHDLGDVLVHVGFADPVMTMEYVTLEYETLEALQKEINQLLVNQLEDGSSFTPLNLETYQATKRVDSKWQLTLEIVYGHAWKVPRQKKNIVTIDANSIPVKKK